MGVPARYRRAATALLLLAGVLLASHGPAQAGEDGPAASAILLRPAILLRGQWLAKPGVASLMHRHRISLITIHHGAEPAFSKRPLAEKLRNLQSFSQNAGKVGQSSKPAWGDIPYHFVINGRGEIGEGREVDFAGDTNTTYDPTGHLLIALEGNFEKVQPTVEQLAALRAMLVWASVAWNVPPEAIKGHNDYARTDCPGRNLKAHFDALRAEVRAQGLEAMAPACAAARTAGQEVGGLWYCAGG